MLSKTADLTIDEKRALVRRLLQERIRLEDAPNAKTWADDATLDPSIDPSQAAPPRETPKAVLLTGATGYLGAFLLAEICRRWDVQVYCLVRAEDPAHGLQRIQDTLKGYLIWKEEWSARITPVVGDLSRPSLGLDAATWAQLTDVVDCVFHAGYIVNFLFSYFDVRETNVLGTHELIRFATTVRLKPLHFASTYAVFLTPLCSHNVVQETDVPTISPGYGYAESKWVSERLLLAARHRGALVNLYRPAFLAWHYETGVFKVNDIISRLIAGSVQLRCAPDIDLQLHLAPVNFASHAMVEIASDKHALGYAYHLTPSEPTSWRTLVARINEAGITLPLVPYTDWRYAVRAADNDNPMRIFLNGLPEALPSGQGTYFDILRQEEMPAAFQNQHTLARLGPGAPWPTCDTAAVKALLGRMQSLRF